MKVTNSNLDGSILKLKLEAEGKPCLQAEHSILKGGSARIVVEECEAVHKRYQVADQILVDGFELENLEIIKNDEFVNIKTTDGRYLKTGLSDYVTEFGSNDKTIAFVNNRNMLNIEETIFSFKIFEVRVFRFHKSWNHNML